MKKFLALLLAVIMVLSLVACGGDTNTTTGSNTTTGNDTTAGTTAPVVLENNYSVDYSNNSVNAGSVIANLNESEGGGEVGYDVYPGISGKDYTDPEYYTYQDYTGGTTDMKWSTHTWETNEDSAILDYISAGFYTFALNSTKDGWSVVCEMASELPVDVTSEYVGKYGIEEGDTLKAWKIKLNENACWEDGTPINADSYIYSYKELLDPLMKNRRADSVYAGDFQIVGAKNYFYQGQSKTGSLEDEGYAISDLVLGADGVYTTPEGEPVYVAVDSADGFSHMDGNTLKFYVEYYGDSYFDLTNWDALVAAMDETGKAPLTEDTLAYLTSTICGNAAWGETDGSTLPAYCTFTRTYAAMDFSEVGIIKTGEYEIVLISTLPIENPNYYVPYNLSGTYLVYESLWESCKSYWDADGNQVTADADNIASITTNYCTNVETTKSYGPYKLSYFELDKQYNLTRNDKWYGYSDGKHLGEDQTDEISVQVIADHATALMAFQAGMIDGVGLQQEDMEKYGSSDYLVYTPESYTTKLTFNTDVEALTSHETGCQVLANANFRKAFSLAIDRNTFCSSYTAGHLPGYGLLNTMYVYDPFSGATYRGTDGAMDALVQLYGLTYGEDGEYGDLEEAYEAITGYDMTAAKALMAQAYDECVSSGLYDGSSNITLEICVYNSDEIYVKMFNFFNDALKAACVGSGFEGKVELVMKADADYYNTMYSGNTDIIFSTWGGAAYSPYSMLDQVYCDASDGSGNQQEYGFDTTKVMVTINVDGHEVTASLHDWAAWAGAKEITLTSDDGELTLARFGEYDADTRSAMFSKLEYAYLAFYATTPLYYRNSVSIHSQKINYGTDEYVDLVGRGGLQFVTYNYTDTEWAAVAGTLTY